MPFCSLLHMEILFGLLNQELMLTLISLLNVMRLKCFSKLSDMTTTKVRFFKILVLQRPKPKMDLIFAQPSKHIIYLPQRQQPKCFSCHRALNPVLGERINEKREERDNSVCRRIPKRTRATRTIRVREYPPKNGLGRL